MWCAFVLCVSCDGETAEDCARVSVSVFCSIRRCSWHRPADKCRTATFKVLAVVHTVEKRVVVALLPIWSSSSSLCQEDALYMLWRSKCWYTVCVCVLPWTVSFQLLSTETVAIMACVTACLKHFCMGIIYSRAGIVPRLRMSGAIPLLPLYAAMAWKGTA